MIKDKKYFTNEIYHSDIYLGEDYSDGIKHFKYIKKERKNGRWVYYYSDAEYDKAQSNYNKAKSNYDKAYDDRKKNQQQIKKYEQDETLARAGQTIVEAATPKGLVNNYKQKRLVKAYESEKNKAHNKKWEHINKRASLVDKELETYKKAESAKYEAERAAKKDKVRKTVAKASVKAANTASITSQKAKKFLNKLFKK